MEQNHMYVTTKLENMGIRVFRFWEHDIRKMQLQDIQHLVTMLDGGR